MTPRVIVTGASGAFGRGITAALTERGASVVGLDLKADPEAAVPVLECDVTDTESCSRAVDAAIETLGGLDALVNNAGIAGPVDSGKPPDDRAKAIIDVNLYGSWNVTAATLDSLLESRGRVVFLGSRMAFLGLPLAASYAISKRGVTAYADCLRAEYGTHISVTCVHPAMVRTPIHDATAQAGLSVEGVSTEEPIEEVIDRVVEACLDPRPGRDVPVTRSGAMQLFVARHAPRLVDRVVARLIRKQVASGAFDRAPMAAGLRARHGRDA